MISLHVYYSGHEEGGDEVFAVTFSKKHRDNFQILCLLGPRCNELASTVSNDVK